MIAKLEWTYRNAQQNIEQLQDYTMGVLINNNRTTPLDGTAAKVKGRVLNAFYWYQIFALDSAVDDAQKLFSLHGSFRLLRP